MEKDEPMTPDEAAAYLKISRRKLDDLRRAGKLTYSRLSGPVRFQRTDLDTFMQTCKVEAV